MGVINVTPDSFSGDGLGDPDAAIAQGIRMVEGGADLLDVGGESTRPGFETISIDEEILRVVPVIEGLRRHTDVPVSVDTYKPEVARAAVEAGASLLNDIHGFRLHPTMARLAVEYGLPAIAMYNQRDRPFRDVIGNIMEGWQESLEIARAEGLPEERVILDPGFNFGWTPEQALEMLRRLSELREAGRPLLIGTSRKSTIGLVLGLPVEDRLEGTAASVAITIAYGADIVRVHDVKEMARVARMADAIVRGWKQEKEA